MRGDWTGWGAPSLRGYPCLQQSFGVLRLCLGVVLVLLDLLSLEWGLR